MINTQSRPENQAAGSVPIAPNVAFVCYTTPDSASNAKQANPTLSGQQLYVGFYEIKEQRQLKNEMIRDAKDFETYKLETFGHPMLAPGNIQGL